MFGLGDFWLETKIIIKKRLNQKKKIVCFWAYVGQPQNHIGWATPMPFASINFTNPRTNPWNFPWLIFENWRFWKPQFCGVGYFEKKISEKKSLLHSHDIQSKVLGYQEWVKILASSQKSPNPNISSPSAVQCNKCCMHVIITCS